MEKHVLINITDNHFSEGESVSSELTTVGMLSGSGEDYSLSYLETDEEMRESKVVLTVEEGKRIVLTRTGQYSTQMIIEKDRRYNCHYNTPYGEMMMGIFASKVESEMGSRGGNLNFRYTLDFNTGYISTVELNVKVEEAIGC